ncbi:hypothetical protein [Actinoplanes sp. NPDC049265]|uniref:hypothetical protein n=1 Tax=Actinoplanes sp. NPDC049265 TaxID=3363902 RepID=UPI003724A035
MSTTSASPVEIREVSLPPRIVVGLRERVGVGELAGFFARTIPADGEDETPCRTRVVFPLR